MESLCGADCSNCGYGKSNNCKGCKNTNGCPFGKQCLVAKYILTGGKENYELFKQELVNEINSLDVPGMPKITDLNPLNGCFVNLCYPTPNGGTVKLLDDNEIYLGNQVQYSRIQTLHKLCVFATPVLEFSTLHPLLGTQYY